MIPIRLFLNRDALLTVLAIPVLIVHTVSGSILDVMLGREEF